MAKKTTKVIKAQRKEILNFEVVTVILVGVIILVTTAAVILYSHREMLASQVGQLQQENSQMNSLYSTVKMMQTVTPTPKAPSVSTTY